MCPTEEALLPSECRHLNDRGHCIYAEQQHYHHHHQQYMKNQLSHNTRLNTRKFSSAVTNNYNTQNSWSIHPVALVVECNKQNKCTEVRIIINWLSYTVGVSEWNSELFTLIISAEAEGVVSSQGCASNDSTVTQHPSTWQINPELIHSSSPWTIWATKPSLPTYPVPRDSGSGLANDDAHESDWRALKDV